MTPRRPFVEAANEPRILVGQPPDGYVAIVNAAGDYQFVSEAFLRDQPATVVNALKLLARDVA